MTVAIKIDVSATPVIKFLDALYARTQQELIRPAVQAGAQVFVDQVRRNVASIGRNSGNLAGSIYQKFSTELSGYNRAEYHISWRVKRTGSLPRAPHGHWLEHGRWRYFQQYTRNGKWYTRMRSGVNGWYPYQKGSGKWAMRRAVGPVISRPNRNAPLAEKMRYFQTLPAPIRVPGKPFIAPAYYAKRDAATKAIFDRLFVDMQNITGL